MTEEQKQLLLKDLSARLPYRVKCKASHGLGNTDKKHEYIGVLKFVGNCYGVIANYYEDVPHDTGLINNVFYDIEYIKPYLRPMSSMTEEEQKEFIEFHCVTLCPIIIDTCLTIENESNMFIWLNAHHFDYRGLIEKGLALKATKDMYDIKTE